MVNLPLDSVDFSLEWQILRAANFRWERNRGETLIMKIEF